MSEDPINPPPGALSQREPRATSTLATITTLPPPDTSPTHAGASTATTRRTSATTAMTTRTNPKAHTVTLGTTFTIIISVTTRSRCPTWTPSCASAPAGQCEPRTFTGTTTTQSRQGVRKRKPQVITDTTAKRPWRRQQGDHDRDGDDNHDAPTTTMK